MSTLNKYLVKIAEKKRVNPLLIGAGTTIGLSGAGGVYANRIYKTLGKRGPTSNFSNTSFIKKHKLGDRIVHVPGSTPGMMPGFKQESHKLFIHGAKETRNAGVNLHELGHAKDFSSGAVRAKKLGLILGRAPVLGAAFAGGAVLAARDKKTEKYAPAIAAVPGVLKLREEVAANYHAAKHLSKTKGLKTAGRYLRKVALPGMATYALAGAALPAGLAAYTHFKNKNKTKAD